MIPTLVAMLLILQVPKGDTTPPSSNQTIPSIPTRAEVGRAVVPAGWESLTSTEGRFTVVMPGKANGTELKIETPRGPRPFTIFAVERSPTETYIIGFSDIKTEPEVGDRQILDEARDGGIKSAGGTLIEEKKISLGPYSGRDIRFTAKEQPPGYGRVCRQRFYLVDRRLYNLLCINADANGKFGDSATFFDTFRLLKPGEILTAPPATKAKLEGWKEYSFERLGVSFQFPSQPNVQEAQSKGPVGEIIIHRLDINGGGAFYQITCWDLDREISPQDRAAFLRDVSKGAVAKGTLLSTRAIKLGEVQGVEFHYEPSAPGFPSGMFGKARLFVDGRKAYMIRCIELFKGGYELDGDAFLDSLKITAK